MPSNLPPLHFPTSRPIGRRSQACIARRTSVSLGCNRMRVDPLKGVRDRPGDHWQMERINWVRVFVSTLFWLWGANFAVAQTVWFAPAPDWPKPGVDPDYLQLFQEGAPWQHALSRVRVFQISRGYLEAQSNPVLHQIFGFLQQHHIALAIEYGFVPAFTCNQHVEGSAHRPDENLQFTRRIRNQGGNLTYITVDETLLFGHYYQGREACRYPIEQLAAGFAREASQVRSVFPNAEIIDTEPSSGLGSAAEFDQWLDALRREMGGGAPRIVRFDVQWYKPWRETVPPLLAAIRAHGLNYGVIFKGTYQDPTAPQYIAAAQRHIKEWQATIHEPPDNVLFANWEDMPITVLPETGPTTLTYLINWYCAQANVSGGCR
jgi:hypothetical protein